MDGLRLGNGRQALFGYRVADHLHVALYGSAGSHPRIHLTDSHGQHRPHIPRAVIRKSADVRVPARTSAGSASAVGKQVATLYTNELPRIGKEASTRGTIMQ